MGTRADFYIKKEEKLKPEDWIGSIAWDGYPDAIDSAVLGATTEYEFREALKNFFAERDDVTLPEEGWPWPWNDSGTSDYAYVFDTDHVTYEHMPYPDMTEKQKVQWGKKSGLMIISAPGPSPQLPEEISEASGGSNEFYGEYFADSDEEYRTTEAMRETGGGFVVCLSELYDHGDYINKRKLIKAFTEYFDEFKKIGNEKDER